MRHELISSMWSNTVYIVHHSPHGPSSNYSTESAAVSSVRIRNADKENEEETER